MAFLEFSPRAAGARVVASDAGLRLPALDLHVTAAIVPFSADPPELGSLRQDAYLAILAESHLEGHAADIIALEPIRGSENFEPEPLATLDRALEIRSIEFHERLAGRRHLQIVDVADHIGRITRPHQASAVSAERPAMTGWQQNSNGLVEPQGQEVMVLSVS